MRYLILYVKMRQFVGQLISPGRGRVAETLVTPGVRAWPSRVSGGVEVCRRCSGSSCRSGVGAWVARVADQRRDGDARGVTSYR
ncbi:hypothetical protein Pen02_80460 [Plantactinospora endophytica]|uniref:Uncharacterized protein n=1 Tax=Plantactinospora endophytica TaxID=673535 RepID=A0ABQ4EEM1_9ACTN|nr:hypothetical protein Pen02_80460 [Plantactinospora endophytica]